MARSAVLQAGVAVLGLAWLGYTWTGHWGDLSTAMTIATAMTLTGTVAAALLGGASRVRLRLAIAIGLLGCAAGFAAIRVVNRWPFAWDAMPDRRYAAFITAITVISALGLVCRQLWARWVAIAFSLASALGGALNSIGMHGQRDESSWFAAIGVIGGLTIWLQLSHAAVREHFDRGHTVWTSRDRIVRSARWAAIASAAAAAMLLLYALGQPVAPQTVVPALVLSPLLMIGSALVVARRAAGILILGACGIALIAQSAVTIEDTPAATRMIAAYYAMFWLPAAIVSIVAAAIAVRRARS